MCRNCGFRKQKPGCTTCIHCLREKAKTQNSLRADRKARGVCPECGKRKLKYRWGCETCVKRRQEATRRYRAKRNTTQALY